MKSYIVMIYKGQGFNGPFLVTAPSEARAVKFAIRELVASGRFPGPTDDNTCKAVVAMVKSRWVESRKPGLKPVEVHPYGDGYFVTYDKKKDKITAQKV